MLYQMHPLINRDIIVHIWSHMGPAGLRLLIMGSADVPRAIASSISSDSRGLGALRLNANRYRGVGRGLSVSVIEVTVVNQENP